METYTAQELLDKLKELTDEELKKPIYFYYEDMPIPITYIDTGISDRIDLA